MKKSDGKEKRIGRGRLAAAALAVAMAALMLTGCGGSDEKVIGGEVQQQGGASQAGKDESAPASGQADSGNEGQTQTQGQKGYLFTYKGVTIGMDEDAAAIVAALGEPQSYFEAASCAFEGLDKIYTYSGFELDTYPTDGADYVSAVIFKDDSVSTAEGVVIGDTKEKVEQTYGVPASTTDSLSVYEKDGMELRFIFSGTDVVSIEYMSTAALSQE